jgi:ATP-binding cassette subfamily B protein
MVNQTDHTTEMETYTGEVPNTPLRFLWYITKPHKIVAVPAFVFATAASILDVLQVYVVAQLVDNFTLADTTEAQLDVLFYGGLTFFGVLAVNMLLWRLSGFTGIAWIIRSDASGYRSLYDYVTTHSHSYFSDRFAGSLSNKISNAASGASRIIDQTLWRLWPEVVALTVTIYLFWQISWQVGVIAIGVIFIVIAYNVWRVKVRRPYVVTYSAASSKLRGEGVDVLTNIGAVRQYARRSNELARIGSTINDRVRKDFKQWYMGEWTMFTNSVFGTLLLGVMLVVMFLLLQNGSATAGELILVLVLLSRVAHMFNMMGMLMNGFIRQYGEVEEGLDEILVDHEITDVPNAPALVANKGEVAWQDVTFEYGANTVFKNFNLTIELGQRVGLVGPSGAGKTTFVSLLLRQHDITGGTIAIDGQNIAAVTQDSLRENIAVVPQEPLLFHRSIRENIAYGKPDATEEEIIAVAKKAQAHDFVSDLPEGYDTLVGERGVKLSGGQKQRIAIARAMLKDAPILVLDEATSALDSESEVAIQQALQELMVGKTVIAIAHRLSTLREMDRILVLETGQIVEDGTHDTLAQAGGTYQRLWEHQAGGFLQE